MGKIPQEKMESRLQAHTQVQQVFSKLLSQMLSNQNGVNLQCCVTYGKPCGCIRKYVLGGEGWKRLDNSKLHLKELGDFDPNQIALYDKEAIGEHELMRGRELMDIYERAADLKKEKCYAFNNVEVEGKTLKELRGMIGLGNGRKRSKKYEDFVLGMRTVLRDNYSLCEKAAQKLLGYSINFLYKKLRTNPEKTSRLVATNKADRASKAPRHLVPLEELREMGRKPNGQSQCCGRNCISRLAAQHFEKIEDWRGRLEGSGQRVAQEIVAEVLMASASIDGQNSFCQNLVHWVTGCSFKKIRRVRDHLKKDPQSLPEHGLKKYWKDKARKQGKLDPEMKKKTLPKMEKEEFYEMSSNSAYPISYDYNSQTNMYQQNQFQNNPTGLFTNPRGQISQNIQDINLDSRYHHGNFNNNNLNDPVYLRQHPEARNFVGQNVMPGYSKDRPTMVPEHPNMPHSSMVLPTAQEGPNFSTGNTDMYQNSTQIPQAHNSQLNVVHQQNRQETVSPYAGNSQYNSCSYAGNNINNSQRMQTPNTIARSSVIMQAGPSQHAQGGNVNLYAQQTDIPTNSSTVYDQTNMQTSNNEYRQDMNAGSQQAVDFNNAQHYYIAAANSNFEGAGIFSGAMPQNITPFVLPQQAGNEKDGKDSNNNFNYGCQPFYIFSPLPTSGDKGFTPADLQNLKQMPMTPIQIYTPYMSGKGQSGNEGDNNGFQEWSGDPQQFFFPMTQPMFKNQEEMAGNMEEHRGQEGQNGEEEQPYSITPVAVVQGNNFVNLAANPALQHWFGNQQNQNGNAGENSNKPSFVLPQFSSNSSTQGEAQLLHIPQNTILLQDQHGNWNSSVPLTDPPSMPENTEKESDAEEKEGGIVTPKIIREALNSKKFVTQDEPKVEQEKSSMDNTSATENASTDMKANQSSKDESQPMPASISSRMKRFSRDRLQATIDSPSILLTPVPPITPGVSTPIIINDSGTEHSAKKDGSPTSESVPNDGSIFRFPPTHISRRMAALRMQGKTFSDFKKDKMSPGYQGPFPVAEGQEPQELSESLNTSDSGIISASSTLTKDSQTSQSDSDSTVKKEANKEPSLVRKDIADNTDVTLTPSLSLQVEEWHTNSSKSPNLAADNDDNALNTPNQDLHTPTQLNTPTHTLNTPTQLNTPTHDISSMQVSPSKEGEKKRTLSSSKEIDDDAFAPSTTKQPSTAKLRFHNFTPKDFESGDVNVSAFRKPFELAQGNMEPSPKKRKQLKSTPTKGQADEPIVIDSPSSSDNEESSQPQPAKNKPTSLPQSGKKPEPGMMIFGNPYSSLQTPSMMQLVTPNMKNSVSGMSSAGFTQPASAQQLNTPVFLVRPNSNMGSGVMCKVSPDVKSGGANRSMTPQFFTFMPLQAFTMPPKSRSQSTSKEDVRTDENEEKKSPKKRRGSVPATILETDVSQPKRAKMVLPLYDFASSGSKEEELRTPSNINVVTPSFSGKVEGPMFTFQTPKSVAKEPTQTEESKETEEDKSDVPKIIINAPEERKTKPTTSPAKDDEDNSKEAGKETKEPKTQKSTPPTFSPSKNPVPVHFQRSKSTPKPLKMTPISIENPNTSGGVQVQTPTLLHLISPSQPNPQSPSMAFYHIGNNMLVAGMPTGKMQSPKSGSGSNMPQMMGMMPRFAVPPHHSSLLKSALRRSLNIFQFPPTNTPSSSATTSATTEQSKTATKTTSSSCDVTATTTSSQPSTSSTSVAEETSKEATGVTTPTSGAAVSVICAPRVVHYSDKLSGENDPCLSEAAQN